MDTIGLSKDSILSSSSKNGRLANTRSNGVSSTTSTASTQAVARSRLDVNPGPGQFDVHFDQVCNLYHSGACFDILSCNVFLVILIL